MYMDKIKDFMKRNKKNFRIIGIITALALLLGTLYQVNNMPEEATYNEFIEMVTDKEVETVIIDFDSPKFSFESDGQEYLTDNPKDDNFKKELLEAEVEVREVEKGKYDVFIALLASVFRIGLMIWLIRIIFSSIGNNDHIQEVKSGDGVPELTFDDVAGQEEAKEEMLYLVDFLKNPEKYQEQGAKLPKGAILYGPPGTGKTLLARAVAGEAKVPFYSANGSDFMEMYVGVGAKRVRALFEEARKNAPAIIFIDEIDSVGGKRTGNSQNTEQQQTINALLSEMDGFSGSEELIVIAATNRVQDLDRALIRPGRFDKHIAINLPDKKDRLSVLETYARNKKLAEDVNLSEWASLTTGFAGADLEALINEAAIISVINDRDKINYDDFDDAYYKRVMKGHKKKNQKDRKSEELNVVAWHEAGHALMAKKVEKKEVPKVTILSSTSGAGGVTFVTPSVNPLPSRTDMENQIKTLYAGRISEYLLLGDNNKTTAGASSDIEEATKIIRAMIIEYGMSDSVGMLNLNLLNDGQPNKDIILSEAKAISQRLYQEALDFLSENKEILKDIASALLEKETLNEDELDRIINTNKEITEDE